MIDRVLRGAVWLLVLAVVLAALIPLAGRALGAVTASAAAGIHQMLPGLLGCMLMGLGTALFCVGLFVRAADWIQGRDAHTARRRAAEGQRARVAARRPAEDVPVHRDEADDLDDPDPALEDEEG